MKISNNLKYLRIKKNMTQIEIAKNVSISEVSYQNYEAGKREPRVSTAVKICKALDTTVEKAFPISDQT